MTDVYDRAFFDNLTSGAMDSARIIVPLAIDLIGPRSVVDVGCGEGAWLRVFADHGIDDYLGVDGNYVDRSRLLIPLDRFRPVALTQLAPLGRSFDLTVCLEVAEHLSARHAPGFIKYLTELAPVVLFSAAVPGQGGTHHVNERWPWYWQEQFAENRFVRLDPIRARVWREPSIDWWYRQNIVVYASTAAVAERPGLSAEYARTLDNSLELIHPRILRAYEESPRRLLQSLPRAVRSAIRRRLAIRRAPGMS